MNKFINPPDEAAGLLGCGFWLAALAAGMALFLRAVVGLAGLAG
jgi:hypothetical protein